MSRQILYPIALEKGFVIVSEDFILTHRDGGYDSYRDLEGAVLKADYWNSVFSDEENLGIEESPFFRDRNWFGELK
jgi:hypothetical protein